MSTPKRKIIKSAGMVGALTLVSRILGMIRDIASASLFGTSRVWDAFVLAFTLPNLMRRFVFEGALSSAFIPIFIKISKKKGREAAEEFASQVGTSLFVLVLTFAAFFYGGLVFLQSAGWTSGKWSMVLNFLSILFPYIFFLFAVALGAGILNSEKHFLTPALSPVILNLAWLFAVIVIGHFSSDEIRQTKILCWVIVSSGALQLLVQWFPLAQKRFYLKVIWDFSSPYFKKFASLLAPAILGYSLFNLNVHLDLLFGYFLPEGSSSSLWYSSRIMQLPLGIFAVSMGTVLLPEYAHEVHRQEKTKITETLSFSLRGVLLIIVPATVGLVLLAHPIIEVLFERGQFTAGSTLRTGWALAFYSLGLAAYSGLAVIVSAFYGIQDMKTPVKAGLAALIVHVPLALVLMEGMKESGIALATTISGIANFLILAILFYRRIGDFEIRRILIFVAKILGVSLIMGITVRVVYSISPFLPLLTSIVTGILVYGLGCYLARIHEMRKMLEWILGKK